MFLSTLALAAEPGSVSQPFEPGVPGIVVERAYPWSVVGFAPGGPEARAWGPDHLVLGPDGAWAVVDPVNRRVVGSAGPIPTPPPDSLAFGPSGELLLLLGRELRQVAPPGVSLPLPGLVPTGVDLEVRGNNVWGRDVFGNFHAVAEFTSGGLGTSRVDVMEPAVAMPAVPGGVGAGAGRSAVAIRAAGVCVVIEEHEGTRVRSRRIQAPDGSSWALPLGGLYPLEDGATCSEGAVAWLDPRPDGLHLFWVAR